jgi:predicted glycoside hydrolase/deacetylase ChbG (UPF0249 family)
MTKLGLSATDRAVIFHADDVGMCQASLAAYADLVEFGLISAASMMVPCSWFPATAEFCRDNPGGIDMGVHLTLTSEWETYRWGPISTCDPASGLLEEAGYLHATSEAVQEHADPDAVQREVEAQVERALAAGIDITHVDTHMGSLAHPKFLGAYLQVGLHNGIPPFLLRLDDHALQELGLHPGLAEQFAGQLEAFEVQGLPLLDHIHMMPLDQPEDRVGQIQGVLEALPAGITYFIIHPAKDTEELRAIAPDWRCRVADYQAFTNETLRAYVEDSGIQVLGWRTLRGLMRNGDE